MKVKFRHLTPGVVLTLAWVGQHACLCIRVSVLAHVALVLKPEGLLVLTKEPSKKSLSIQR